MSRFFVMLCVLCFFSKAEDSQFSYDFPYKALDVILYNNEKLKQLEFEIKSLEFQAKSESKWDNVRLNFGYSNAEILMPFNPSANEMQNIFIGLEQDFDMNQKRKLQAQITNKEAKITGLTKRKTVIFHPRKRKQHNVKYLCQRIINIDKE